MTKATFSTISMLVVVAMLNLMGCVAIPAPTASAQATVKPAFKEIQGWCRNNTNFCSTVLYKENAGKGYCPDERIDAEVGDQVSVKAPWAITTNDACKSSARTRILSGVLPPGLNLNGDNTISGIVTERGIWIVKLEMYDINMDCGGITSAATCMPFEQTLIFKITGSLKVHS